MFFKGILMTLHSDLLFASQLETVLEKPFNHLKVHLVCSSNPDTDSDLGRPGADTIWEKLFNTKKAKWLRQKSGAGPWSGAPAKEEPLTLKLHEHQSKSPSACTQYPGQLMWVGCSFLGQITSESHTFWALARKSFGITHSSVLCAS